MAWTFSLSFGKDKKQNEERSGNIYGPETNALYGDTLPFGFNRSHSGVTVTEESAMGLTAVTRCINIISNSIAKLPRQLMEVKDDGDMVPAVKHPLYNLISNKPADLYTKFNWDRNMLTYRTGYGNAYGYIKRNKFAQVEEIIPLFPWACRPYYILNELVYYNADPRYPEIPKVLKPYEVFHLKGMTLDGFLGRSPIRQHAESIGISLATETYGATFFQNNGVPDIAVVYPNELTPAQAKFNKEMWKEHHNGDNAHSPAHLGGGIKIEKLGVSPEDAQLVVNRKYGKLEVATIFGVPPHMLADLDRATFSNIEQQSLDFITNTLMEYAVEIESEFHDKILFENDKTRYKIVYDFGELMRGDMAAMGEFISKMINVGVYSQNDGRKLLKQNRVESGDQRFVQVNLMPMDKIGPYYDAQMKMKTAPAAKREIGFKQLLEEANERIKILNETSDGIK